MVLSGEFFDKNERKVSTKEMFENNSLPQETNFYPRYLSKKIQVIVNLPPTDSKEKLAQKKISEEKSLPNKFQ